MIVDEKVTHSEDAGIAFLSASFPTWEKDSLSARSYLLLIGFQGFLVGIIHCFNTEQNEFKNEDFSKKIEFKYVKNKIRENSQNVAAWLCQEQTQVEKEKHDEWDVKMAKRDHAQAIYGAFSPKRK